MKSDTNDITLLQQWTGKTATLHDVVRPEAVAALAATLDYPSAPQHGAPLPPLWHWINFWTTAPQSGLGPDGHARRGGFLPPVPQPRRMWAGGRLAFPGSVPVGAAISRTSTILDIARKTGAGGDLRHDGQLAITEEHDIVYRDLPAPGSAGPAPRMPPGEAQWSRKITPDPVLLFRYSALTFNGHRIHYDRSYVTEVEGYPGLIVHGPLIATLLMGLLRAELPQARVAEFSFRAVSPLFDTAPFTVNARSNGDGSVTLWAANSRGELAMQAEAKLD